MLLVFFVSKKGKKCRFLKCQSCLYVTSGQTWCIGAWSGMHLCWDMYLCSGWHGKTGVVWLLYVSCGLMRMTNEPMALGNRKLLWIYIYIYMYIFIRIYTVAVYQGCTNPGIRSSKWLNFVRRRLVFVGSHWGTSFWPFVVYNFEVAPVILENVRTPAPYITCTLCGRPAERTNVKASATFL
jgi:hypothetical protein